MTAFIGGGNMTTAIIGGLRRGGWAADSLIVVDPNAAQRERLAADFGVRTLAAADASLQQATLVVWAVKPQFFKAAAVPAAPHIGRALQLSVMAGIRSGTIAAATGSNRIVRAMPNTPALIGQGIAGLYADAALSHDERRQAETVLAPTGAVLWVEREADLDAVTALSGSGPAYVFYVIEAMVQAAERMGLSAAQGRQLALATFAGATALAQASAEPVDVLRERVTSKGGTTAAAIAALDAGDAKAAFGQAFDAAQRRAREMGDEFAR